MKKIEPVDNVEKNETNRKDEPSDDIEFTPTVHAEARRALTHSPFILHVSRQTEPELQRTSPFLSIGAQAESSVGSLLMTGVDQGAVQIRISVILDEIVEQ